MLVEPHTLSRRCPTIRRRWKLGTEWRALYELSSASEFNRLVRLWWALLPVAHSALSAQIVLTFWPEISVHDLGTHLAVSTFILACLMLGIWAVHLPGLLITRHRWIPWVVALIEGAIALEMALVNTRAMSSHLIVHIILMVLIAFWGLRLSLWAAVKSAMLGGLVGAVVMLALSSDQLGTFIGHHLLACVICLFCVFLEEEKNHESFMQAVELARTQARLRAMNQQFQELAHQDALTGLPNRRELDRALSKEWLRALRGATALSVLIVDVDHFKKYNDAQGHLEGDACLMAVAHTLQAALQRPGDVIARFGGEEFVVLLPDTDERGAREVAQRLLKHVDDLGLPHPRSDTAHHVTISVGGVTLHGRPTIKPAQLLQLADEALYRAKSRGRHRLEMHAGRLLEAGPLAHA